MSPSSSPVHVPGTMADPVVRARAVERVFAGGSEPVVALHGVDLDVAGRGLTVLTGPSGCGKTTMLSLVIGTEVPDAGSVEVCGREIGRLSAARRRRLRRDRLGIGLARPSDNLLERLDVGANVRGVARLRRAHVDVDAILAPVGLGGRAGERVDALSGGEQQRLAIALAFLGQPALVVLDEPTAELDARTGRMIVEYLRTRHGDGALLVASHDPYVVEVADMVVTLEAGRRVA